MPIFNVSPQTIDEKSLGAGYTYEWSLYNKKPSSNHLYPLFKRAPRISNFKVC